MTELRPFDRVANVYDQTRAMPPAAVAAISDTIAGMLREVAPAPHLFEVGIGTGRIAVPLAERGVRVTGIDIAPDMVARLRAKRTDIDVAFAEAARPPFRDGVFAGALFVHILHLVPDAEATVRAAMACVHPGGWLILGGDDRSPGHRDEAEAILGDAIRDITGSTNTGAARAERGIAAFERVCAGAGLAIDTRVIAEWTSTSSGRELIDRLRARTFSQSWQIPDDKLEAVVAAVEPGLRALYGDLAREVEFTRRFLLRTVRRAS